MTEEEARAKAIELAAMLGLQWQPRVWHNLYWCYSADFNGFSVHYSTHNGYSAFYTPHSIQTGHSKGSPMAAVLDLINNFQADFNRTKLPYDKLMEVFHAL